MEIQNLYNAYSEIFDIKDIPEELLENSLIIPFYFEQDKNNPLKKINFDREIVVFPPSSAMPMRPMLKREAKDGDIPKLVFKGEILGLYLPFHFYFRPDKRSEDQVWGVWINSNIYESFKDFLSDIQCSDEIKSLLTRIYIVNFALFYHKIEIFITSNEIFERQAHYKHHFGLLVTELAKLIDKHAHNFARKKILTRISFTNDIDASVLRRVSEKFGELFESASPDELKQEYLLNEIYNKMHIINQLKPEGIWIDLKHLFDSGIKITSRDNLFERRAIQNPL